MDRHIPDSHSILNILLQILGAGVVECEMGIEGVRLLPEAAKGGVGVLEWSCI